MVNSWAQVVTLYKQETQEFCDSCLVIILEFIRSKIYIYIYTLYFIYIYIYVNVVFAKESPLMGFDPMQI